MEGEMKNMVEVWSSAMASLCYCYFVSSRIPKGKYRLISLLPVISLFAFLPLHLTFALTTLHAAFFLVWLANFRILLFAFDMGPLSPDTDPKSLPLFIALACFPVKTKQNQNNLSPSPSKFSNFILNLPTEILLISIATVAADRYRDIMNLYPTIKMVLYYCVALLQVDIVITVLNAVVMTLLGVQLDRQCDKPFFSTSLQDFWGKRWNIMVTNHLRCTVYEPVKTTFEPVVGRKSAGVIGVFASFVVSGLMHELLYYYPTRVNPTWEVTAFFVLHGLCVMFEFSMKQALVGRWRLRRAVSVPLTIGFVVATSFWLHFPRLMRLGLDKRIREEHILFLNFLQSPLSKIIKPVSSIDQ